MESTNKALCFIFLLLKYFVGIGYPRKFFTQFFYNEINSNENFPDYGIPTIMKDGQNDIKTVY